MPPKINNKEIYDRIRLLHNGEYVMIGEYEKSTKPITLLHIPCGHSYKVGRAKSFLQENKGRCPNCRPKQTFRRRPVSENEFLDRLSKQNNSSEYEYLGGFVNMQTKSVKLKHNCGHIFTVSPKMFTGVKQTRCPKCSNKNRGKYLKDENYLSNILNSSLQGNEYIWKESYKGSNKIKHKILHKECNREYSVRPNDFQQDYRCPHCALERTESINCQYITDVLNYFEIKFDRETSYEGCINKLPLRFDFDILLENKCKLLIEYDGEQHFKPFDLFGGKEGYQKTKERDQIKNKFCEDNPNLFLERLNYKQNVHLETLNILKRYIKLDDKKLQNFSNNFSTWLSK